MGKILLLVLISTAAIAIASRNVRSGGSGWQASSDFDGGQSGGFARSPGGGWAGSGAGLGRSAGDGGWRGTSSSGSSRSQGQSANGNRGPSSSGWSQGGYGSNGAYSGRNSFKTNPGWNDRFADSTVVESLDSSNSWNEPEVGFHSNNGWQSSGW